MASGRVASSSRLRDKSSSVLLRTEGARERFLADADPQFLSGHPTSLAWQTALEAFLGMPVRLTQVPRVVDLGEGKPRRFRSDAVVE